MAHKELKYDVEARKALELDDIDAAKAAAHVPSGTGAPAG